MKIKKLLFLGFLALFVLAGCKKEEQKNDPLNYEEIVAAYLDQLIPNECTEDIALPIDYTFEDSSFVVFIWSSSNPQSITDEGQYRSNLFDDEVVLSAQIVGLDENITYQKSVKTKGKYSSSEYKQIIEAQIPSFIFQDVDLPSVDRTYNRDGYVAYITYEISDPTVLSSEGKYITQSKENKDVVITYHIDIAGIIITGEKNVVVQGRDDQGRIDHALNWLEDTFKGYVEEPCITDDITLPKTDDQEQVSITWVSSAPNIVTNEGVIATLLKNQQVTLTATIELNGVTGTFELNVRTFGDEEAVQYVLNLLHKDEIHQTYFKTFDGSVTRYTQDDLGYIHFYLQDIAASQFIVSSDQEIHKTYAEGDYNHNVQQLEIHDGIIPWTSGNRSTAKKTSTQYIVFHDTGDIEKDAAAWNEIINTDNRQTSWNFTVDDKSIYQHIPLDEVAWHAGDGSTTAEFFDTGVLYEGSNPTITVGNDGFFYLNGKKSKIVAPSTGTNPPIITESGIYTYAGENGNYMMSGTYYNSTYRRISMTGGNRNGIGIETCIHQGVDYNQVMRNTANLIAHLLVYFDLGIDRVMHHRNFSGKMCPQSLIRLERFPEFMELVKAEYFILINLSDLDIKYTSETPSILSNEGKIIKKVTVPTEVKYTVEVTTPNGVKTYHYSSTVYPQTN